MCSLTRVMTKSGVPIKIYTFCISFFDDTFCCLFHSRNGELNLSFFGGVIAVKHELVSEVFFNHQVQRQDMCSVHTCHHVIQQMQNATLVLILTEISLDNTFKTPNEALLNYTSRSVSYPL
ncbi:unnamed protein product, partial [Brassica oleracea var. botrytis]